MKKINRLFQHADEDGDGAIDVDEFEHMLQDPDIKIWLSALELDVQDHSELFRNLDKDRNGSLSIYELVDGVRRLKGTAKNYDVTTLLSSQQEIMTILRELPAAVMREHAVRGSMLSKE